MKLSIILPTYNNQKTLEECLKSLFNQDLSKKNYEVLLIDGGSTDATLKIAKKYPVKIVNNVKRSEEPARILGIQKAQGEIIGFIDADNVLMGRNFLKKMLAPFDDSKIIFGDTLYWGYRKKDKIRVRYQVLIGGDDPLATYLGLYSRWCFFTNNWTAFPYKSQKEEGYIKVSLLDKELIPAMGSNGFFIRTKILRKFVKDTFIHSDLIYKLVNQGYNCFAKVDAEIVHNQPTFFKNKIRRILRRQRKEVEIKYNYGVTNKKIIFLGIRSLLFIPIVYDVCKGFMRKRDIAWVFHFPALYGLLAIHFYYSLKRILMLK